MINTKKNYDKEIEILSNDGDILCRVLDNNVKLFTINIGFYIKIRLCDLRKFYSTLKKVWELFITDPDGDHIMASMYGKDDPLGNEKCMVQTPNGYRVIVDIPVTYKSLDNNDERPWVDKITCERLIDFIESYFILHEEELECCKDILSVVRKIKELK